MNNDGKIDKKKYGFEDAIVTHQSKYGDVKIIKDFKSNSTFHKSYHILKDNGQEDFPKLNIENFFVNPESAKDSIQRIRESTEQPETYHKMKPNK